MAEFGAKLCSEAGCRQHDFLPWTCSACGRVFCQAHMAIGSGHRCDAGDAYLASVSDRYFSMETHTYSLVLTWQAIK